MTKGKKLRLQLLGILIVVGCSFWTTFMMTGYCMAGLRPPAPHWVRNRYADAPHLTRGEWLIWTALEWRLARSGGRPPVPVTQVPPKDYV